ncbi:MAG: T9SS type A sorting domain-containing protein, partial [Sphingomonadales bacterium]|nr:T9SS type A sorting domain-containing protein [Sphingomonadales bacterium]
LAMTANSNGSMTINFNPTPSASQHWVRYRAAGSATWNSIPVVNRPHSLVSGAGTFEVQAGAKVGNRTFWSCSSFITVLPTGNINRNVKFRVNMTGLTVNPAGVYVVGNLQGFNAGVTRLMPTAANPNIFEKDTVVYNGFTMNYKFANGDQITDAEIVPAACSVNDATHGALRTVTVTSDLVLSAVLYGQCGDQFVGRVAGTLTYDNTAATAMTNSTVSLSGSSTGSQGTAAGSSFGFDRVVNGNYSLAFSTNKPWGGVSSSDALIINRHIVGSVTLAGIRLKAADVNNSATVTTGDALLVNRRVAGLVSSFTGGNWVYSTQTGSVNNDTVTVNAKALCVGDVNGSYVPSTAARMGSTTPEMNGVVETRGGDYTLEIGVDRPVNVGAVTLFIDLPAGMEVRDVQPALAESGTEVAFKQEGRRLNIAWYTLDNWNLQAGEALIRIVARGNAEGMIQIDNASEIADLNAEPVSGLTLRAARLVLQNEGLFVYPNPSNGLFNLHHANTMDQIRVSDAMGKVVSVDYPSSNRWVIDLSNLPLGIYSVEVRSGDRTETQKVVIR